MRPDAAALPPRCGGRAGCLPEDRGWSGRSARIAPRGASSPTPRRRFAVGGASAWADQPGRHTPRWRTRSQVGQGGHGAPCGRSPCAEQRDRRRGHRRTPPASNRSATERRVPPPLPTSEVNDARARSLWVIRRERRVAAMRCPSSRALSAGILTPFRAALRTVPVRSHAGYANGPARQPGWGRLRLQRSDDLANLMQ